MSKLLFRSMALLLVGAAAGQVLPRLLRRDAGIPSRAAGPTIDCSFQRGLVSQQSYRRFGECEPGSSVAPTAEVDIDPVVGFLFFRLTKRLTPQAARH